MFMTKTGVFQFRELDNRRAIAIGTRNEHNTVVISNELTAPEMASIIGCVSIVSTGKGRD